MYSIWEVGKVRKGQHNWLGIGKPVPRLYAKKKMEVFYEDTALSQDMWLGWWSEG